MDYLVSGILMGLAVFVGWSMRLATNSVSALYYKRHSKIAWERNSFLLNELAGETEDLCRARTENAILLRKLTAAPRARRERASAMRQEVTMALIENRAVRL